MLQQINTENFQQMLAQFSTTELESLIEKFPYFQQAHLLLAQKYQQENNPKFDQQLQLAALYIQDRELLYSLFNGKDAFKPVAESLVTSTSIQEEKAIIEAALPEVKAQPEQETEVKQEVAEIEITESQKEEDTPESIAAALAEIKQTMEAIQQIADEAKVEEANQTIEVIRVEEEALPETVVHEAAVEESQTPVLEVPQDEIAEKIELSDEENKEETTEVEVPRLEVFSRIEPHTFDEWLNAFNNKSKTPKEEKPVVIEDARADEELTQLIAENITVDYLHGLVKEETNYARGLERFIEEQIQKHKQPEIKKKMPENVLEPELITETMAKVFEMQKKYAKAIEAYEALTLKFPEKSSLFAARINYLKNIL
jgi:hypothetical protein